MRISDWSSDVCSSDLRKVRLLLGEKGVGYELVRESPWERRDEFIDLNPAGRTPVMVDQARGQVLMDSNAIAEYFEETVEGKAMINGTAANRAENRRMTAWFDHDFYYGATGHTLIEGMQKSTVHRAEEWREGEEGERK